MWVYIFFCSYTTIYAHTGVQIHNMYTYHKRNKYIYTYAWRRQWRDTYFTYVYIQETCPQD